MSKAEPSHPTRNRRGRPPLGPQPDPVDVHIGNRIRLRRTLIGLSQVSLAQRVGVTFQQVQKYERAGNRVSASMLRRFANALDVPIGFFFDDLAETAGTAGITDERMASRESLDLMQAFHAIPAPLRRQVYELIREIGRNYRKVDPLTSG